MIAQDDILAAIASVELHRFRGTNCVACCLTLLNGHNVVGLAFCHDPEDFNFATGTNIARQNAEDKVAELLACERRGSISPRTGGLQ